MQISQVCANKIRDGQISSQQINMTISENIRKMIEESVASFRSQRPTWMDCLSNVVSPA